MKTNEEIINEFSKIYGLVETTNESKSEERKLWKYPDKNVNYLSLYKDGLSYISIANTFDWNTKNNTKYWEEKEHEDSYTKYPVSFLRLNSFVNCQFSFLHVKKGNYRLFLHERHRNPGRNLRKLVFTVSINDKEIIQIYQYPSAEIMDKYKGETVYNFKIIENSIGYIEESQFDGLKPDKNGDYVIKLSFVNRDYEFKEDWYIDGARLLFVENKTIEKIKKEREDKKYPLIEVEYNYDNNDDRIILLSNKYKNLERIKKINREYKASEDVFQKKLKNNLTRYLMNFLDDNDIYELIKTNIFIRNNIVKYIEDGKKEQELLSDIEKYKLQKIEGKDLYKFPDEKNYLSIGEDGRSILSIARKFNWAHKDNESYWTEKRIKNSYDGGLVPYLDSVCWLETNFNFLHVKPNYYKLYVHECYPSTQMSEEMLITILINEKEIKKINDYPSDNIIENSKEGLHENLLVKIDKNQFEGLNPDINGDFVIQIQFRHKDMGWKGGWYIDGGRLLEITEEEFEK